MIDHLYRKEKEIINFWTNMSFVRPSQTQKGEDLFDVFQQLTKFDLTAYGLCKKYKQLLKG